MKARPCPKIEIIAVGSELLRPHFHDTNSGFLVSRLAELGLQVSFRTIISDEEEELKTAFECAKNRAGIVFTIGGLGPTRDDRTRSALAFVLRRKLVFNKDILKNIEARFRFRGLKMPKVNERQAQIIDGADILENRNGTAPGLWIEDSPTTFILLPGPPHELKAMYEDQVFSRLKVYQCGFGISAVLKTTGLSESQIESIITSLYPNNPDISLTTLAYPGQIEIHLFGRSKESKEKAALKIKPYIENFKKKLKKHIFSEDGKELEEIIAEMLTSKGFKLAVAESCTGGLLANRLTNVPGSSKFFILGVTAYSNEAKSDLLSVPKNIIENFGAVSPQTARKMAEGIRQRSGADFCLSITGIAGPSGGTADKPVGLVYTGLSWKKGAQVSENRFLGNRKNVKFQATQKALDMLRYHFFHKEQPVNSGGKKP
ncbi:MAG: competence/damage-inducible protein A [Candidatus Aminicenantes bacterium]|nr:competence/damage-inducible protein A [Candidatus Aminicenantes bacterium]